MNPKIEINALSISKSREESPFLKYDIETTIDEVENSENYIKLKYVFTLLSNPKNARISVDGFASINGTQQEISNHLTPDENNIPLVVNIIYQELFPLFFVNCKSMQIPCPTYKLSQISQSVQNESVSTPNQVEEKISEPSATVQSTTEPVNEQTDVQPTTENPEIAPQQVQ